MNFQFSISKNFKRAIIFIIFCALAILILFFGFKIFSKKSKQQPGPSVNLNQNEPVLSFAVIGDPESDLTNLEKALTMIKNNNLSLAVLVGDLTSTGTPKQFEAIKKILDKSQVKYFTVPGNHDLWYEKKENIDVYQQYFDSRFLSQDFNSYQLFFLDNSDEWLGMGSEQLNWFNQSFTHLPLYPSRLRASFAEVATKAEQGFGRASPKALPAARGQASIVFLHIPLYHPESKYVMGYREEKVKKEAKQLLIQLCQNPPLAIFSGHLHHTNQFEYKCANGNILKMISAGSVSSKRNWQKPRFLKAEILSNQELKIEEVVLEDKSQS